MAFADPRTCDVALAREAAELLRDRFADYNARFATITRRARRRFERRDWAGARDDAAERIALYDRCVGETTGAIASLLGPRATDKTLWAAIKAHYAELIATLLDQELNKTFFNTLSRRFFRTVGVDPAIEFVALDIEPTDRITHPVSRKSYAVHGDLDREFERVLGDFAFGVPYAHPSLCASRLAAALEAQLGDFGPVVALEMLETVFYRERRAYLVGRVFGERRFAPLVIALVNDADGIRADAVISDSEQVAQVFGFTRAYFQADLATVGDAVVFLRTLLPRKPIDEIYTVLGRAKQGKTERYRSFFRHLAQHPDECFVHADGERGMVMAVFTLPSYPLVFKVIRDRFAAPKTMQRTDVMAKYALVFRHDRVGRLVDAQEFRHLRFPRRQFAPALLDELLATCGSSVAIDGDDLVVAHCYVERRLRPLNLVVREDDRETARRAVLDYGQAIKDLARSNIFPGDLLLKNFGMTRHGRAIFYDYDELALVTECRFRRLPQARDDDEETHAGAWYHVGEHDVFPEQFPRFLGLDDELRAALIATHGEIFDPAWWNEVKARIERGDYADLPPYPQRMRLAA
jgi:isocitrate dehydrogenase kinase/phosphatase